MIALSFPFQIWTTTGISASDSQWVATQCFMVLLATLRPRCTKMLHSVSCLHEEVAVLKFDINIDFIYIYVVHVCGRYKTRYTFTWNVLVVPHPLPPQSKQPNHCSQKSPALLVTLYIYAFTYQSFILPIATHPHFPGWWCHSAILALQQWEEGVVWMGRDWALLLRHPQSRRTLLHDRPVKMTHRPSIGVHARFWKKRWQSLCTRFGNWGAVEK